MPLRLKAEEQNADVVIRKTAYGYRIYPITDVAVQWLKAHEPHAVWKTINGRKALIASRTETARMIDEIHKNDFQLCGHLSG